VYLSSMGGGLVTSLGAVLIVGANLALKFDISKSIAEAHVLVQQEEQDLLVLTVIRGA
jgi:hypothetical protein